MSMELTEWKIEQIARGLAGHVPRMNATQFAEAVVRGPSWASRLFRGQIKSIPESVAGRIEELLRIDIHGEPGGIGGSADPRARPLKPSDLRLTAREIEALGKSIATASAARGPDFGALALDVIQMIARLQEPETATESKP